VVLTISNDLPFAQDRFCMTEGIENVITLSQLRDRDFGMNYGCEIKDGPLAGLLARAVVVIDENNRVVYNELVNEITQEPDYNSALKEAMTSLN
jgi:thiol peroxidase